MSRDLITIPREVWNDLNEYVESMEHEVEELKDYIEVLENNKAELEVIVNVLVNS